MPKSPPDLRDSALRAIPSVERILSGNSVGPLIAAYGRARVKEALSTHLDDLRTRRAPWDETVALDVLRDAVARATSSTLRRVINGSGGIIHTNLGRSPISAAIWQRASAAVSGYANLEFDLEKGERGARDEHPAATCHTLVGYEAAILTNNNAAATLLALPPPPAGKDLFFSPGAPLAP